MSDVPKRGEVLSHEAIVKNFVGSGAVDFKALGGFVAEFGESIAISSRGDYGVRIGHYNILACFYNRAPSFSPADIARSGIATEVVGE
jgi:hypothetical protein